MCFALIGPIDDDDDGEGELPCVDHDPLNEGAVIKRKDDEFRETEPEDESQKENLFFLDKKQMMTKEVKKKRQNWLDH